MDLAARELRKSGFRVRLQDQRFRVLALVVERRGGIVTREELREAIWSGDTFVEFDASLNTCDVPPQVCPPSNPKFHHQPCEILPW